MHAQFYSRIGLQRACWGRRGRWRRTGEWEGGLGCPEARVELSGAAGGLGGTWQRRERPVSLGGAVGETAGGDSGARAVVGCTPRGAAVFWVRSEVTGLVRASAGQLQKLGRRQRKRPDTAELETRLTALNIHLTGWEARRGQN